VLIGLTGAIVFLPLGHYMVDNPEIFWYRAATRASTAERNLYGSGLQAVLAELVVFIQNNLNAALAFNVRGDVGFVVNVIDDPFLDRLTGAAFLIGVGLVLFRLVRQRCIREATLLALVPILMLSSTLALAFPIENPSSNRSGPAAPVVFAIAALPIALLFSRLTRPAGRVVALSVLLGLYGVAAELNYTRYFVDFDEQYRTIFPNTHEVADAIKQNVARGVSRDDVYLFGFPYWLDGRNVAIAIGDIRWSQQHELSDNQPLPIPVNGRPMLFVLNRADVRHRTELEQRWPNGTLTLVPSEVPGKEFYTFLVQGSTT
jgi:hypothetical protein